MKQATIYIIEDDPLIVELLTRHLTQDYDVVCVRNFRAVSQEVAEVQPDIVLMDISLPYYNGFYWTTEIRKTMTMPILFLSSSDEEMNAVMAMQMGGDDFIGKPFSLPVLEAKIAAFLRRTRQFSSPTEWTIDEFHLTLDGVFFRQQDRVHLSPTETKIFSSLLEKKGQVVSKEILLEKLWESEEFIDHNTLHVNMTRLRKKVGEVGFDRIHTVRGVGYLVT